MARARWDNKLSHEQRNELDAEIRRRGYGDLAGLVDWLAERNVHANKSSIHVRSQRLKRADETLGSLSPAAQQSALELAAAIVAVARAWGSLQRHLEAEPK